MEDDVGKMTWPEYRDAVQSRVVVFPVGALDPHGPHLPLATDTILAETMADELAARTDVLRLPPLTFGRRTEPARGGGMFPGAIDLTPGTLAAVIMDILTALHRDGAHRILIIDNHMANIDSLRTASTTFAEASDEIRIMVTSWWDLVSEETRDHIASQTGVSRTLDHHAALVETSLMMYARPRLVRTEHLIDEVPERVPRHFLAPFPQEFCTDRGVVYRARGSSAEIGRLVFEEVIENLVFAVAENLR